MSGRLRQVLIKRYAAAFLKDAATISGGARRIIEGWEAASVSCQQTDLDISAVSLVSFFVSSILFLVYMSSFGVY